MGTRRKPKAPDNAFWVAQGHFRPRFVSSNGQRYPDTTAAFYRVLESVFPQVDKRTLSVNAERSVIPIVPDYGTFYPRGMDAAIRIATPEQRKAFNELFMAILDAIESSHKAGIERGKSLLVQLASGALTTNEFNNSVIKGEKEE